MYLEFSLEPNQNNARFNLINVYRGNHMAHMQIGELIQFFVGREQSR